VGSHPGLIATIWRGSCIIRAAFLDRIPEGYEAQPDAPSLLLQPYFRDAVIKAEQAWRDVVVLAVQNGIAVPAFASCLAYFDGLRRERGPANLLQGLRDFFGAHSRATLLPMSAESHVESILRADSFRWHVLDVASALGLPDSWIGAGFVRNAVWDHLHGRPPSPLTSDVDVIWYDLGGTDPAEDRRVEAALRGQSRLLPGR
jgi:6-phosphogluconate dehydrogenase, C-terminal domain/Nucleotidyltransferase